MYIFVVPPTKDILDDVWGFQFSPPELDVLLGRWSYTSIVSRPRSKGHIIVVCTVPPSKTV